MFNAPPVLALFFTSVSRIFFPCWDVIFRYERILPDSLRSFLRSDLMTSRRLSIPLISLLILLISFLVILFESNSVPSVTDSSAFCFVFFVESKLVVTFRNFSICVTYLVWACSASLLRTNAACNSKNLLNDSNSLLIVGTAVRSLSIVVNLEYVSAIHSSKTEAGGGMEILTLSRNCLSLSAFFLIS